MTLADLEIPAFSDAAWLTIVVFVLSIAFVTLAAAFAFFNVRLKRALKLARAGERAQTSFLATMSHEIRTPLNAVIGFAEFLCDGNLKPEEVAAYAEGVGKASHVLLELINDVLDLSKLESGRADVRHGELDVRHLADELRHIFEAKSAAKGVRLSFGFEGDCVGLDLSPSYFRQALLNLVGNSVKFTDSGSIAVTFATNGCGRDLYDLRISVADTGSGITPEILPTIFDPFVQDIARRGGRVYEGTGLGLPIVKRIVETAGGTVTVTSEVGKGTTFVLNIPQVRGVRLAPEPERKEISPEDVDLPASILLVDDVAMNLRVLSVHLQKLGLVDIRTATSGKEALALFAERPADVVLTDMWMPGMNGTELAQRLRVCGAPTSLGIVAVTADAASSSSFDMTPFTAVLTKPVTREKLLEALTCCKRN